MSCDWLYQSTRPALRSGTCSGPTSPYPLVPTRTHQYPPKFTRSASLNNSPGPQALSIHKVRRPSKFTRSAGLINAPVPQALSIHQARRPYHFTRSTGRINLPGPQALSINQVRRPYQFTCISWAPNTSHNMGPEHVPQHRP